MFRVLADSLPTAAARQDTVFSPKFLQQLELLRLRARRSFLGTRQGGHVSLKRGHGIEFADYRKYDLGDDLRHIDWGVYARSDRLYVKKFQEEQDLKIYILLDSSASMTVPPGENKWEVARDIALALAYIGLMQQDTVFVSIPGVYESPAFSGGRAFHSLVRDLKSNSLSGGEDFLQEARRSISRMRHPGLAIVISDLLFPSARVRELFNSLRARNMDITAIQLLAPSDLKPLADVQIARAVDSETGEEIELAVNSNLQDEYDYLLKRHNHEIQEYFVGAQVEYVQARSDQAVTDFVIKDLSKMSLLS
ncbi:MAG: DUF58 domain-containing protein [Bdellovibrionales bacterium]|nr:DUF58 domain-containing protein [Bdellovibrionales bacterium]